MDVLVDLDGTLVDPKPGLIGSIQYALDKLGHPVPPADELLWMIGPPLRVSFPIFVANAVDWLNPVWLTLAFCIQASGRSA